MTVPPGVELPAWLRPRLSPPRWGPCFPAARPPPLPLGLVSSRVMQQPQTGLDTSLQALGICATPLRGD